ncbi:MAG: hypothetical protein QOI85_1194, partial [Chloroflexota bacterium]|nr:hypothetical protein [Chloroflexota bacterium]
RVGVVWPAGEDRTPDGLRAHHGDYLAALRDYNAEGKMARGRNWTIPLLLRHTAFHVLDHAWEMEDKDLSSAQSPEARESARGSAPPS